MGTINVILLFCLVITQLVWTFTSPFSLRQNIKQILKIKSGVGVLFSFLLLLQALDIVIFPLPFNVPIELKWIGVGLVLFGSFLSVWAKHTMKGSWGVPAQHDMKRQNKLITEEPFSFSRNPIYVGLFSIFIGVEIALGSMFILLSIPLLVLIHKAIIKEENLLEKYFKKEYRIYKKKTPRYLFI